MATLRAGEERRGAEQRRESESELQSGNRQSERDQRADDQAWCARDGLVFGRRSPFGCDSRGRSAAAAESELRVGLLQDVILHAETACAPRAC